MSFMLLSLGSLIGKAISGAIEFIVEPVMNIAAGLVGGVIKLILSSLMKGGLIGAIVGLAIDFIRLLIQEILDATGAIDKLINWILSATKDMYTELVLVGSNASALGAEAIKMLGWTPANFFVSGSTSKINPNDLANPYFLSVRLMKDGVMPTAMTIFALIVMVELFQITLRTEGMRNSGFEAPFKLMVKVAVCKIVLDNTQMILETIFGVGTELFDRLTSVVSNLVKNDTFNFSAYEAALRRADWLILLFLYLQVQIQSLLNQIVLAIIPFLVFGRMIEIYIYTVLAPIPFATFAHQEFSSTGKNFIKQLISISLKVAVIYIIIVVFGLMSTVLGVSAGNVTVLMLAVDVAINLLPNFMSAAIALGVGIALKPLIFSIMLLITIISADKYAGRVSGQWY